MNDKRRISTWLLSALLIAVLMLMACDRGSGGVDGIVGSGMKHEIERMDRQLLVGMQLNADSVLGVIDSLQTNGYLPLPVADYERGMCHAVMERRRTAEYYFKKALEGNRLFELWPEACYRSSVNLAILLSGKNDEQGAIQVATSALSLLHQRSENETRQWAPALLFNLGSSQLRLGYHEEGGKTLRESLDAIKELAGNDPSAENLRAWVTIAVNIATVYSNVFPDDQEPWLHEAEYAVKKVSQSREIPKSLIDMLRSKVASLKALFFLDHHRLEEAEKAFAQYLATDYAKMPQSYIERLTFLEKSGRWEEASRLLPDIWQLHEDLGTQPDIDYLSDLAEGFTVNRKAGYDAQALEVGDRMAAMVDSVRKYILEDAAAELAVIYDSQQKKEEIFQQQWRLRRQQGAAVAVILTLIIAFLMTYLFIRRREGHRLKVAYGLLKERNDELLVANEKAEESSRMKTKFIQQISHEIRTPLNILSGFTQIVTTPGLVLEEQEMDDIRRRIVDNTDRITRLVNKMLDLSEASSQTVIEKTDQVTVAEIAINAIDVSGIRQARHLDFSMKIEDDVAHTTLKTNLRFAAKALAMLLDNAMKFTHEPVENDNLAEVAPEKKELALLTVRGVDDGVEFVVEDSGCGVPPEEAEHIFEEFVQLNEFYEGTGIGLSVARSIVRRLGGEIWLETAKKGTKGTVPSVPLAGQQAGTVPFVPLTRFVMKLNSH